MKDIYLTRKIFTNKSTVGKLVIGDIELFTLEDTMRLRDLNGDGLLQRHEKVWGKTAIPSGSYEVVIRDSKRFKRPMPYLLNVPFFDGIMIHPGNIPENTEGCLLVGMCHPSVDFIGESRIAFDKLFPEIERSLKEGRLWIHIAGGYTVEEFKNKLGIV